jgi:predicted aspartyl protease
MMHVGDTDNEDDHYSVEDIENVSERDFVEEETTDHCLVLRDQKSKRNTTIAPAVKATNLKKSSVVEKQVEEWTAYIKGHAQKPKVNSAPTVISTSRPEKAKNKPLIQGFCEGQEAKLFLDTGAEVNVIDLSLFKQLQTFTDNKIPFKPQEGTISCANGSKMKTYGMASLKIKIGKVMANLHFTVASNLFPKIIVGIRGMKTLNIQLNPANSCAIVGKSNIPFVSKVSPQSIWTENESRSVQGAGNRPESRKWLH